MSDLLNRIRYAQMRSAEDLVVADLEARMAKLKPIEPHDHATPTQPAIEPSDIEVWSRDEENFYEASDFFDMNLEDLETGHTIYRGEQVMRDAAHFMRSPSDLIVDHMQDQAWQEANEHAEDWPTLPAAKWAELDTLIRDWINSNVPVTFWTVRNVKPIVVTDELLAEWGAPGPAAMNGGAK